jgi:Fe-S oxidoreductase
MTAGPLAPHQHALAMCTYCPKVCRFSCPVSEASHNESHSAWGKMTAAAQVANGQRKIDDGASKAIHACTGCGRCTQFCKHDNQVGDALFAARTLARNEGLQPKGAATTLATFTQSGNPFGTALGEVVARFKAETPMRHPLFPGCSVLVKRTGLIDDTLFVASAFGAPMGLCKASARCCGYPLYAGGAQDQFVLHARSFAKSLEAYPELVVMDPGCAHTLAIVYPRFGVELPSRIRTLVEVLSDNLPHAPDYAPLEENAGYHDACHLGRGLGQYEAPRALLRKAVRTVGEAPSHHAEGGCSGGGGLVPRTMPEVSVEIARRQAVEVAPEGQTVVTACATSQRMFERAGKKSEDLISTLRRWLEAANERKT